MSTNDNRWEIIDNRGVIYSGTETEMRTVFGSMKEHEEPWYVEWQGDLKLVQVHGVAK